MPRNVLIALDESSHSLAAFNYAVENILRKDDTVTFVHVHKTDQILYRTGYTGMLVYCSVGLRRILKRCSKRCLYYFASNDTGLQADVRSLTDV